MDQQIADLARTASTTMVTLMVTNAWESARGGLVGLWRRFQPGRADAIDEELESSRTDLLLAREIGDEESEAELVAEWQGRVRRLLVAQPEVADELRRILDELNPHLPEPSSAVGEVHMTAEVSGSGRVYQAGRDQHITER